MSFVGTDKTAVPRDEGIEQERKAAGALNAHLTDHDIVHELVQGEMQRCAWEILLLAGAPAVEVAPPGKHSVVLIVPL